MVVALAFVPSPPLLLDRLGGGPEMLRSACLQAIGILGTAGRVVVVGAAPADGWVTGSVDATPYGAPGRPAADALPLALAVGATLLRDRQHDLYGTTGGPLPELAGDTALLVVGDASARRTEKAPGHYDERAAGFDAAVVRALADGDPAQLLSLDEDLAAALLVGGLAAWRSAALAAREQVGPRGAAPDGWSGQVHLAEAPYGVGYCVASWTPRRA